MSCATSSFSEGEFRRGAAAKQTGLGEVTRLPGKATAREPTVTEMGQEGGGLRSLLVVLPQIFDIGLSQPLIGAVGLLPPREASPQHADLLCHLFRLYWRIVALLGRISLLL